MIREALAQLPCAAKGGRVGRTVLIRTVTTLDARGVGVKSLTNGIVDTTTAHGKLVFGMFALMAEYEAALIKERTLAGLVAARARGRHGGRKPKMTPALVNKAQRMYDSHRFTMAEIAQSCTVSPMTIYQHWPSRRALINARCPALPPNPAHLLLKPQNAHRTSRGGAGRPGNDLRGAGDGPCPVPGLGGPSGCALVLT